MTGGYTTLRFLSWGPHQGSGAALGPQGPKSLFSFFLRHRLYGCVHVCACVCECVCVQGPAAVVQRWLLVTWGGGRALIPTTTTTTMSSLCPPLALWLLGSPKAPGTGLLTPGHHWLQPGYLPSHGVGLPPCAHHGTHAAGLALATLTPQPLWDFYLFSVSV